MNKKILSFVLIAVVLVGIVLVVSKRNHVITGNKTVDIGVILPLTGSGSDQGESVKRGLSLAQADINQGGKLNVNLIYEDSQGDPKIAVNAYKNLTSRYHLPAVITWGSGVGVALTSLTNNDKVIQMGVATSTPDYRTANDFTFRNFPSVDIEAQYSAHAVYDRIGSKRSAILYINNSYGVVSAKSFKEAYVRKGGTIVDEEMFEPKATDVRTQLLKIKATYPEMIYLAAYPQEGAVALKQARELGIQTLFYNDGAMLGGKELFDAVGDAAEGLIILVPTPAEADTNASREFNNSYRQAYNEYPQVQQFYAARSYDALKVLAASLMHCSEADSECIKEKLFQTTNYSGAAGKISFDRNGDVTTDFALYKVEGKKFVPYR